MENGASCPNDEHVISNDHGKCYKLNDKSDQDLEQTYSDAVKRCQDAATDRPSCLVQFTEDSDFTSLYKLLDDCK